MEKYVKHTYDVDIVSIYYDLVHKIESNTELAYATKVDFKTRLKELFLFQVKRHGHDETKLEQLGKSWYIVFTPQNDRDNFIYWFALMLATHDTSSLRLPLVYHMQLWRNKVKYLNFVEFSMIRIISNLGFFDTKGVQDELNHWLYEMRILYGYFEGVQSDVVENNVTREQQEEYGEIDDETFTAILFADKFYRNKLLSYIQKRCKNSSDRDSVLKILHPDGPDELIPMEIPANELIFLFRYLEKKGKITFPNLTELEPLITNCFVCKGNGYEPIGPSYCQSALRGQKDPPKSKIRQIKSYFNLD